MPQSLLKMAVHVVFGTKQRKNLIPRDRQEELWAYVGGIARNQKIRLIIAGGMRDHLHLLFEMPATRNLADVVKTFKANRHVGYANEIEISVGRVVMVLSASARLKSGLCGNILQHSRSITRNAILKKSSCCY